jgi:S-adenosylmethionine decarboxylase
LNNFGGPPTSYLGRHVLAEFFGCNSNILNNVTLIEQILKDAARACGATIVQSCFHLFNPYGVSGVVIIAESHLTVHTWPEAGYAALDFFTCGDACDPMVCFDYVKSKLVASDTAYQELHRGIVDQRDQRLLNLPPLVARQLPTAGEVEKVLGYDPYHIEMNSKRAGISPTALAELSGGDEGFSAH